MSAGNIQSIVIIGGGQAAMEAAATLRKKNYAGDLTLLCAERHPPYQRPPLSKQLLAGKTDVDAIALRPRAFFESRDIVLRLGCEAVRIDRGKKQVHSADGERLSYDRALIATGAAVRRLKMDAAQLDGVLYLRSVDDCLRLRARLRDGLRLAIIGGGYIGMEVAATACSLGCRVTVLEMAPRIMSRQVAPEISSLFEARHKDAGVDIRCGAQVAKLIGKRHIEALQVDGERLPTDLLVVGIGVLPNLAWLADSGLCDRAGIGVDARCRSADEAIFAAGDVALQRRAGGVAMRVESVQNAVFQGRGAALAMLDEPPPADEVPWFWSDQFELRLQIAGCPGASDRTVLRRYDRGLGVFFVNAMEQVTAVNCVSNPREFMLSKKIIAKACRVDRQLLADPENSLQELLK